MILGEVVGRVWNDRQVSALDGHRLVVVREHGATIPIVAVDLIHVATGNTVLVATDEAAQDAAGDSAAGIDAAVVSLVSGTDAADELGVAAEASA